MATIQPTYYSAYTIGNTTTYALWSTVWLLWHSYIVGDYRGTKRVDLWFGPASRPLPATIPPSRNWQSLPIYRVATITDLHTTLHTPSATLCLHHLVYSEGRHGWVFPVLDLTTGG